jgi:hypothetical protein
MAFELILLAVASALSCPEAGREPQFLLRPCDVAAQMRDPDIGALRHQRCRSLASPGMSRQLMLSLEAASDQEAMRRRPPAGWLAVSRPERCRLSWRFSR